MALDLTDRGLITLGGSLYFGDLETWQCADCWTRYGSRNDQENESHYLAAIEQAFQDYHAFSPNKRRAAKGAWVLRLITVRLFELGISEARIESTQEGTRVMVRVASEWEEASPPPASLTDSVRWLVENELKEDDSESVPQAILI